MQTFNRTLLAGVLALTVSAPTAAQFSNFYSFGDSLTDAGTYRGTPIFPPPTGVATTNPGPVWAEVFAANYGLTSVPASKGGNNYAVIGARVSQNPGYPPGFPPTDGAPPILTQISQFLSKGPLDGHALYSVWGGANDLFIQLDALQAGQISQTQLLANMGLAATQLVGGVAQLQAAGARYVIVFNMPDVGKTPFGMGSGASASISAISAQFNGTLIAGLNKIGGNVIRVDSFNLINEVVANPTRYGFTNVTSFACTSVFAGNVYAPFCTPQTLVSPSAPQTYAFADSVHPTTATHALIAQAVESMITGPQQIAALGEAPFAVEEANFRALDGRMWSNVNAPRTQNKLQAWASYDYGSLDMNAGADNGSAYQNTIVVGGDMKLSDKMLIGGSFGYSENKGDFGGAGGGYKLRAPVGTFYLGYGEGPWYMGATLSAGGLDYSDVNRNIPLGLALRNESGQTRGNEYTARLLGGYWFKWQDVLHGPYARVAYTKSTVRQYSETGSDSTALMFGEQKTEQLLWSLGWQVAGNIGNIRPYARATWEYDSLDKDRTVSASSVTLGGWYSIPVAKPDNNYALFSLGASADMGGVTGYVTGSATAARGDGNYWAITVGIRSPL
jgi:outer membrane lipase/esterase